MSSNITLSAASRTNLMSLQSTAKSIAQAQNRLSTGLAVSGPSDDAVKYFQARSLSSRATDLTERKDAIDQGVSTLDATLKATGAIEKLVTQIKGIVNAARSQTTSERKESGSQLKELVSQMQKLVDDSSYKGLNLLNSTGSTLTVRFSDKGNSKLDVKGVDFRTSKFFMDSAGAVIGSPFSAGVAGSKIEKGLGFQSGMTAFLISKATVAACFNNQADKAILRLDATISNLRAKAATISTNSDILKVRLDFTSEYTSVLQAGADKLTLADMNTESANLLALQTRQSLGINALSLANQSEQGILQLFR